MGGNINEAIESTPQSASINLTSSIVSMSAAGLVLNQVPLVNNISVIGSGGSAGNPSFYDSPNVIMAFTGSAKNEKNQDVGIINLRGPNVGRIPGMAVSTDLFGTSTGYNVVGPSLMLFNSINNLLSLQNINPLSFDYTVGSNHPNAYDNITVPLPGAGIPFTDNGAPMTTFPFIPATQVIPSMNFDSTFALKPLTEWGQGSLPILTQRDLEFDSNFFKWNVSGSNLSEYRDIDNQKILVEKGDEIRVSYAYQPNLNNDAILNKTYQDFTVLGYDQVPPALYTSNFDISTYAITDVRFEIACYSLNGYQLPNSVTTTFRNPLPADGYYSFSSLKDKYLTAKNNSTTMYILGINSSGNEMFLSGSIVGVSRS
jgi:hypothetical protein